MISHDDTDVEGLISSRFTSILLLDGEGRARDGLGKAGD